MVSSYAIYDYYFFENLISQQKNHFFLKKKKIGFLRNIFLELQLFVYVLHLRLMLALKSVTNVGLIAFPFNSKTELKSRNRFWTKTFYTLQQLSLFFEISNKRDLILINCSSFVVVICFVFFFCKNKNVKLGAT